MHHLTIKAVDKQERKKGYRYICTILFFLTLSNSTFYQYNFTNLSHLFVGIALIMSAILEIKDSNIIMHRKQFSLLMLFFLSVLIPSIVKGFNTSVLFIFLRLLTVFITIEEIKNRKMSFFIMYEKVIFVFGIWALVNYFLNLLDLHFLPVVYVEQRDYIHYQNTYGYLFVDAYSTFNIREVAITRMYTPFSEPGVAQLFFNFGLVCSLFINKKKKKALFYMICTIMTFSLIGVFIMLIILLAYLISKKRKVAVFLSLICAVLIGLVFIIEKVGGPSYLQRTYDYKVSIEVMIRLFPFGKGINNEMPLEIERPYGDPGFYCGIIDIFIDFGIFGFAYLYFLIHSCSVIKKQYSRYISFCFGTLFFLTLITEPIQYCNMLLFFIVLGMVYPNTYRKVSVAYLKSQVSHN